MKAKINSKMDRRNDSISQDKKSLVEDEVASAFISENLKNDRFGVC